MGVYDYSLHSVTKVDMNRSRCALLVLGALIPVSFVAWSVLPATAQTADLIGAEHSGYIRTANGEEQNLSVVELFRRGSLAFNALWTPQEGGGRPMTTGAGNPLINKNRPLSFPFNFNRVSAMDANSCAGCHNAPFGISGGGGDFVTGVFVAAQRFDAASFDHLGDAVSMSGAFDFQGNPVTLSTIGNYRATLGMFGSGYIEMLARQITADLQFIRDSLAIGESAALASKGISFGTLTRTANGYDVSGVQGLPPQSLAPAKPSLVINPFHQSGSVVSLRQFTNNAFNHHHGIQSEERFGSGQDPDGDGFVNELTIADITAVSIYQAALAVPGQVIPDDPDVEKAILLGEQLFTNIGCASCHVTALPLDNKGWIFTEPSPYSPAGNLQPGQAEEVAVDLSDSRLPGPRIVPGPDGIAWVRAFTDFKLHDITTGEPGDPNREALDINFPGNTAAFHSGNSRFLTKKLWGGANERPYFHHGKYTTLREATLAHFGEAKAERGRFLALSPTQQNAVIEFLKSLQVLQPGATSLVVNEKGNRKVNWPPCTPAMDRDGAPRRTARPRPMPGNCIN